MSLLLFPLFGSVIGFLALRLTAGGRQLGAFMTVWLGIAGSLLGALLASFITLHRVTEFHIPVVLGGIVGSFAILAAGGVFRRPAVPSLRVRGRTGLASTP